VIVARLLGVSERTVRRWKCGPAGCPRGRPALPHAERLQYARHVVAEWRRQGKSAGWRPISRALPHVPTREVQRQVAAAKRRHRAACARRRQAERRGVVLAGRDVLWSLDATHLGREGDGSAVQAQAVREVASMRTLAISVGAVVKTDDAISVIAAAAAEHGGRYPLVLATDNGAPYTSGRFEQFLEEHEILHLRNLPHTPRHNPWVERGNRDFKEETGFGKGVVIDDVDCARKRLDRAIDRLDGARLRAGLGYRTARAIDAALAVPYTDDMRALLGEAVRRRVQDGLHDQLSARAVRVLRREAILASLDELGMIERTRGGPPRTPVKQDVIL